MVQNPEPQGEDVGRWEASVIVYSGPGIDCYELVEDDADPDVHPNLTDDQLGALLLAVARRPEREATR